MESKKNDWRVLISRSLFAHTLYMLWDGCKFEWLGRIMNLNGQGGWGGEGVLWVHVLYPWLWLDLSYNTKQIVIAHVAHDDGTSCEKKSRVRS